MPIVHRPFADYFNVSFPCDEFDSAAAALRNVLGGVPSTEKIPGLVSVCDSAGEGVAKFYRRGNVGCASFSGGVLAVLREARLFGELLHTVALSPHRVTLLHATLDVAVDAPSTIEALYCRARDSSVSLSRKRVRACDVIRYWGPGWPGNVETGTLYLGKRTSDVWAKVYDKRSHLGLLQQAQSGGELVSYTLDPGPLTRYEVALGRHIGCSLADVSDPERVFWHFAGDELLPRPSGIAAWSSVAEGYVLPPRREVLPAEQLELLLERSPDIERALRLARAIGGQGFDWFVYKLRKRSEGLPGSAPSLVLAGGSERS